MYYCQWPSCVVAHVTGTWPVPSCYPLHGQVVRLHTWSKEWCTADWRCPVLQCCLIFLSRNQHSAAASRRWYDECLWSLSYIIRVICCHAKHLTVMEDVVSHSQIMKMGQDSFNPWATFELCTEVLAINYLTAAPVKLMLLLALRLNGLVFDFPPKLSFMYIAT